MFYGIGYGFCVSALCVFYDVSFDGLGVTKSGSKSKRFAFVVSFGDCFLMILETPKVCF